MQLSRKERLRRAFRRGQLDRLPTQVNCTSLTACKLAEAFGISTSSLPELLDNHLLRVDLSYSRVASNDGATEYDWWGAGWDTRTEGYWHSQAPLRNTRNLDDFAWPDPARSDLLHDACRTIAACGPQHFIVPNFGMCLFERAWSLRGFDQFLLDLMYQPAWAEEFLDRIVEIQLALVRRFIAAGVDGGYFGDDYGAQRSMLFSPKLWRSMFKPRLAKLFEPFRNARLPVILHSDGDIRAILPDLVEIGVTVLNPVQPEVLDPAWLSREFGRHLCFYGGISTQGVLPSGTPQQVRDATLACARTLAPEGTGLLLGPSHRMQSDIPLANVAAMLQAMGIEVPEANIEG